MDYLLIFVKDGKESLAGTYSSEVEAFNAIRKLERETRYPLPWDSLKIRNAKRKESD